MNKKGGITNAIFLVIGVFFVSLVFLFMYVILSNLNTEFQASDVISSEGKRLSGELTGKYPSLFDRIFIFVVVGLGAATIVGAFLISSHPALFWFSIPVFAFIIWLGALFANIYNEITLNDQVTTFAASFPLTSFIYQHFVLVITVFILILAIALFGKSRIE